MDTDVEQLLQMRMSPRGTRIRNISPSALPITPTGEGILEVTPYTLGRLRSAWKKASPEDLPALASYSFKDFMKDVYWEEKEYQKYLLANCAIKTLRAMGTQL